MKEVSWIDYNLSRFYVIDWSNHLMIETIILLVSLMLIYFQDQMTHVLRKNTEETERPSQHTNYTNWNELLKNHTIQMCTRERN